MGVINTETSITGAIISETIEGSRIVIGATTYAIPYVSYEIIEENDATCTITIREYIEIHGDFKNTIMDVKSNYGDSGEMNAGTEDTTFSLTNKTQSFNRGTTVTLLARASYTGGSGTYYSCEATHAFTVPMEHVFLQKPTAPTSATITTLPSATAPRQCVVSWSWPGNYADASCKVDGAKIYRSQNGQSYTHLADTTDVATTKYTDSGLSDNSNYKYQICCYNSAGESDRRETDNIAYTKPSAPTISAYQRNDTIYYDIHSTSTNTSGDFKSYTVKIGGTEFTQSSSSGSRDGYSVGTQYQTSVVQNNSHLSSDSYLISVDHAYIPWVKTGDSDTAKAIWVKIGDE